MPDVVLSTPSGSLLGRSDDGLLRFHRVPYAEAPVGGRRFAAPVPLLPWTGIRGSAAPGPIAPQPTSPLADSSRDMSEDCLFLDVVTPSAHGRRPVVVWLHGGGYFAGSSLEPDSDGARLSAEHDVVVVSVTHRLGILGFLDLEPLGVRGSGLAGHLDLIEALRWIRVHIAAFGGDPGRVTVVGHSGGGGKTSMLLSTPGAERLMHGAVIMAGPEFDLNDCARAEATRTAVSDALGLTGDAEELVSGLRRVPAEVLLQVQEHLGAGAAPGPHSMRFSPVVGRRLLPLVPTAAARVGTGADIPLIIGTARDESHIVLGADPDAASRDLAPDELRRLVADGLDRRDDADRLLQSYRGLLPDIELRELWLTIASDQFRIRSLRLAEARLTAGTAATYVYRYDVPATTGSAAHGAEVPAFFGWTGDDTGARCLSAFARTGIPDPSWRAYSTAERHELRFRTEGAACMTDPDPERRTAWDGIATGPGSHPWARLLEPAE
ncbi:carboxylesterase/lipase family protein [Microbacterium azadirachtae]|uniref:Carboxylic ester hydrolase n=1 Tax=Microbacterium azadirachtae TaxID=582680 RepID=A0A0F0LPC1_9MICO|nr:carboxylesterase family protein [Microbacterium azadirachtae]KJL34539.1 Para-nitrobenzyl esterase [Microbacterium azadirachtae]